MEITYETQDCHCYTLCFFNSWRGFVRSHQAGGDKAAAAENRQRWQWSGAGASRGFAHIGVLKVLEANNIPVNMIVGASAGSFVGSLYAYGFNAFQLQQIAIDLQKSDIIDFGTSLTTDLSRGSCLNHTLTGL